MSTLGDNLQKCRLAMDLSQAEVATKINKARETYSRYETGTLKPDIDTLIELADLYHVQLDWLTGRVTTTESKMLSYFPGYAAGAALGDTINRKRASKRSKKNTGCEEEQ